MDYNIANLFKFNDGRLALLCRRCGAIIKEGKDFDEVEETYVLSREESIHTFAKILLTERLKKNENYCLCAVCRHEIDEKNSVLKNK